MIIKEMAVGPMMANCFIVGCDETKDAVVIDPGDDTDRILLALADLTLKVRYIINTHGHFDHVGGNRKMKAATGADILIHSLDAPVLGALSSTAFNGYPYPGAFTGGNCTLHGRECLCRRHAFRRIDWTHRFSRRGFRNADLKYTEQAICTGG